MIKNKLVTIRKLNSFDRGWALVAPYQTAFYRNKYFRALSVSEIVQAITKSTVVNLILSEPCLSSQIVKELEWVNKYIALNIIAKNKSVVDRYAKLKFTKVELDSAVDFNYIAIKGKTDLFALIAEDYIASDARLNNIYFENTAINGNYEFIKGVSAVLFIDENNNKDYSELLNICLGANIPTAYLVGILAFNQDLVHKFKDSEAKLLCSERVRNGILYSTQEGRLYCANLIGRGILVSVEIERAEFYTGVAYESLKAEDTVSVDKIPQGSYVCNGTGVTPLKIEREKVIERTINIGSMEEFVTTIFDKSETDEHNQYCTEAEEVIYNFTLVPPLFKTDKIADIYNSVESVFADWKNKIKLINLSEITGALKDIELNASGFFLLCEEIINFDKRLTQIVKNHNYKNYYAEIKNFIELVNYSSVDDYCKELFTKVNAESTGTKFDKFDDEIAGYRQTVEEKKALIARGIEVLSNKRRVEILEKKIADLTAMKQRFTGSASARDNKQSDAFLSLCKQVTDGKFNAEKQEIDSIGNVLTAKELSKLAKLEIFVKTYLYEFNQYIVLMKEILKRFEAVDIPTEYVVYEQDGNRVIAIDSEKEYYDTEDIRKHFNLHCFARR